MGRAGNSEVIRAGPQKGREPEHREQWRGGLWWPEGLCVSSTGRAGLWEADWGL